MINKLRALSRFFIFLGITLYYLTPILLRTAIRGQDLDWSLKVRKKWARACTRNIGIDLQINDPHPVEGACVYVCNHRSYYDPIAALTKVEALPVAKAEMSKWPLIGFAAKATGILFVKRESRESRRTTLKGMQELLSNGKAVLIFPEGTTHLRGKTIRFRYGAFKLAARNGVPIVPVAIGYSRRQDAWVRNDTFVRHFFEAFGRKNMFVKMRFGAPIHGDNFEELVEKSKTWIDENMAIIDKEWLPPQRKA
jgi:1-acyl-sn-glycerol-3-phosphate acyltransferase